MPLDTSYVRTLGDIYAQRNQALQGIAQSALGGAAQVGAAAIGRKKDATALQADLDRTQGNVQMETQQLIDELARIREARSESNKGPYESAMMEQAEAETTGKLRDIGKYQSELGAIGDIGFGNVYKVRMPERLQPIGSAASKGRVMDLQAQSELEKTIALGEGRKAADAARRQAQLEDDQRSEARKLAAEQRASKREADRDAREAKQAAEREAKKGTDASLTAGETTPIATNLNTIKGTLDHIRTGEQNKDKFGRLPGRGELVKSSVLGSGFGETMRAGAKRLAVSQARVRTQGNPTESDIAAAQDVAGDITLDYDQWKQNQLTVLDEAINQTELQIKLTRDGAQKAAMVEELENAKRQRAALGQTQAAPKGPITLDPDDEVVR